MYKRYRTLTKPVSVEHLKLGMHVADQASTDQFPMKAGSLSFDLPKTPRALKRFASECGLSVPETKEAMNGLDKRGLLDPQAPPFKALRGLKNCFSNDVAMAIWTRLIALSELSDEPEMQRWSSDDEPSDIVLQVAATFPFRSGTYSFNPKPFLEEVERRVNRCR